MKDNLDVLNYVLNMLNLELKNKIELIGDQIQIDLPCSKLSVYIKRIK